jgi:CheY-like chemotaxis protein
VGVRVVVVEDHRDVALAVEFALRALGHDVHLAHDAMSGLRAVIEHLPEVVLIDLVLPVVDGWQLARSIRELDLAVPPRLVAMSGFASDDDRARSAAEGFEEHLAKPIRLAELSRLLGPAN